jgi:hypothetical protein
LSTSQSVLQPRETYGDLATYWLARTGWHVCSPPPRRLYEAWLTHLHLAYECTDCERCKYVRDIELTPTILPLACRMIALVTYAAMAAVAATVVSATGAPSAPDPVGPPRAPAVHIVSGTLPQALTSCFTMLCNRRLPAWHDAVSGVQCQGMPVPQPSARRAWIRRLVPASHTLVCDMCGLLRQT